MHMAILNIFARQKTMVPKPKMTVFNIIDAFISKSYYYRVHKSCFNQLTALSDTAPYSEMLAWVADEPDAPSTAEIWGSHVHTPKMEDLAEWLRVKQREKESSSSGGESSEKPKQKKKKEKKKKESVKKSGKKRLNL